ncbi:MAG TPA: hypothetical protein VGI85_13380 [Chthoniobacterales bacterium]
MSFRAIPESANEAGDLHHGWEVEKAGVQLGAKLANQRDHPPTKTAENASGIGDQGPLQAILAGVLIVALRCVTLTSPVGIIGLVAKGPSW